MRKDITVVAEQRDTRGKNEARRLRVKGMVPAVVYGVGRESVPVALNPRDILKIVHSDSGHNTIFNLDLQGETTPVMVVDEQYEPIKDRMLHVDLLRIDLTRRLTVKVPVHFTGDARGVKQQGGVLDVAHREVTVECLPDEIPAHFTLDVAPLGVGDAIRVSDLAVSGSMKVMSPPDLVIVHVVGQRGTDEAAAEATVAEPEVIKKGKKETADAKPAAGGDKGGDKGKKK